MVSGFPSRLLAAACLLTCATTAVHARTPEAAATLVVFNRNDPDSEPLARYYAGRRDIAPEQVVGLDCPPLEEITRGQFDDTIATPLRKLFKDRGWWTFGRDLTGSRGVTATRIRFLALVRGMPLKIMQDPTASTTTVVQGLPPEITSRNDASVDSELTLLGMDMAGIAGFAPNPYYQRFTPVLENPIPAGMLLPSRLDGPTPEIVRAMIDDALLAEKQGVWGWGYVDGRNITEGGLAEGDAWLKQVVDLMRQKGIPVIFDNLPPTFPDGYPMSKAAAYYGWYAADANGPFANPSFAFETGAIAVHIHSFSAATLRSTTTNWCGPLLARGATATLGNVYEPYLAFTANLAIFQDRLVSGLTLAEAGYMAQRVLSWMSVVIGDPLYRPYAAWQQVTPSADNQWAAYRRIIKRAGGSVLAAGPDLKAAAIDSRDPMFLEALAMAQADAGADSDALSSLEAARPLAKSPIVKARLDLEMMTLLAKTGRTQDAAGLASQAAAALPEGPTRQLFAPTPAPTPAATPEVAAAPTPPPATPPPTPLPTATPVPLHETPQLPP